MFVRSVSNIENDYNPFKIPVIHLENPNQFRGGIAFKGCPPMHRYTKSMFASFPIEFQAAYADGVARGSYMEKWFKDQPNIFPPNFEPNVSSAYVYLKTHDQISFDTLNKWCSANKENDHFLRE